jgi:hypothetical protein
VNFTSVAPAVAIMLCMGIGSADGEQTEPRRMNVTPPTPPKLIIRREDLFPLTRPARLGMLTLLPAQTRGEVVRVSLPIGELVSRGARTISDANRRHAERKADERVRKDLERFVAAATATPDGRAR